MQQLRNELNEIIRYLEPLLPIANSHTVNFITDNTWLYVVPEAIRLEVDIMGVNEVIRKLWNDLDSDTCRSNVSESIKRAKYNTVEYSSYYLPLSELESRLNKFITNDYKPNVNKEFMSSKKKTHEVEIMTKIVSRIAAAANASHIVDIGSGKGYLTSTLVLQHHFKVLGIDCKDTNILGAEQRTMKLEKLWDSMNKKSGGRKTGQKEKLSSYDEYYDKYKWRSVVLNNMYKQCVKNISDDTNLSNLIEESFPDEYCDNVSVIGLHTCGNLASSCFRMFVHDHDVINSIINIGCCYHLIDEEFATDTPWHKSPPPNPVSSFGFPLSSFLREKEFSLGRDARMCGTQVPKKIFEERKLTEPTKPLFYRALLQEFFVRKFGENNVPKEIVGRLAHKCGTFSEYVHKALKKLHFDIKVEESELQELQLKHVPDWENLKVFFLLKTALSSVIESVILMDKVLYLHEQGVNDAFVAQLFDPLLSPRCYAVIGIKNNPTLRLFL